VRDADKDWTPTPEQQASVEILQTTNAVAEAADSLKAESGPRGYVCVEVDEWDRLQALVRARQRALAHLVDLKSKQGGGE